MLSIEKFVIRRGEMVGKTYVFRHGEVILAIQNHLNFSEWRRPVLWSFRCAVHLLWPLKGEYLSQDIRWHSQSIKGKTGWHAVYVIWVLSLASLKSGVL